MLRAHEATADIFADVVHVFSIPTWRELAQEPSLAVEMPVKASDRMIVVAAVRHDQVKELVITSD